MKDITHLCEGYLHVL